MSAPRTFGRSCHFFTYKNGVLRFGANVLPLPLIPESPRLCQRVAFSILLSYFQDEPQAERKAHAMHRQLARRIATIYDGWHISASDLDDTVVDILVKAAIGVDGYVSIDLICGERRDTVRDSPRNVIRMLSTPLHN